MNSSHKSIISILSVVCVMATCRSIAQEQLVWQIGSPDHDYGEFAMARNYSGFSERFGTKPLVFEARRNEPGREWPFIHPGPVDAWAG